jgi:UDP-N-acetylglucosamine transferase subunit ALG13
MILVSVGASEFPFDRLLHAVAGFPSGEALVVQHGPSAVRPAGADCVPFVPLDTLATLVREARAVVTHAGVGSILFSLANGKRPYVVPRRREFGETVDDHQLESARRFAETGLVTLVEEPEELTVVLRDLRDTTIEAPTDDVPLVHELRNYIDRVVGS